MAQYIDKSALVAEIERRIKSLHQVNSPREQAVLYECKDILSFINTLDVKKVDLEKEIDKIDDAIPGKREDIEYIAKHFFELGLKAQNYNNKCEDLRDDGICNFATTKLGRTIRCESISCSRRNKVQKGE